MIDLDELHAELFQDAEDGPAKQPQREAKRTADIAIIGMAVKLPMANSLNEFWNNVISGNNSVQAFPPSRRAVIDRYLAWTGEQDWSYLDAAYLEEVDRFDYQFFRLSPREASFLSPDQRLFLECAWETLENAGYGGKRLTGSKTGVFVGYVGEAGGTKYRQMILDVDRQNSAVSIPGNLASIIPSRLSYLLDLHGPSMVIDTACSSSLIAVHQACQAIRNGECEMAVAGGVRTDLIPLDLRHEKLGIESSDGQTRTYDQMADGSGLGEGTASVLLKPLDRALEDGDHIYAVIKGGAANQDGHSLGITAPNGDAQADVMAKAWKQAGIDPETLSYIETHGTGTTLGDVIEIEGLRKAFDRFTDKKGFCALGSVKTNIGHLYQSAGIAGLVKTALALYHRQLPPSIHFNRPNQKLNLIDSPVYINTRLRAWDSNGTPRRAGISSFGLSGTNCHLVLEEAPHQLASGVKLPEQELHVLALSAQSSPLLQKLAGRYAEHLQATPELCLADLCYTANTGRGHYSHRAALVFESREELLEQLAALCDGHTDANDVYIGEFKIVPQEKGSAGAGEITEQDERRLSRHAAQLAKSFGGERAELDELCALYVQGAEVPWDALYRGRPHRRLPLPGYPFARESCWLEIPEPAAKSADRLENHFYALNWQPEPLPPQASRTRTQGAVLILHDEIGIGRKLADRMREQGQEVFEARLGDTCELSLDGLSILRGSQADFESLFTLLKERNVTQILHLCAMTGRGGTDELHELEDSQRRGVYSLFHMVRGLLHANPRQGVDIVLIADCVSEVTGREALLKPEHAPLFGIGKVIGQEHPELTCRAIDIDGAAQVDDILTAIETPDNLYQVALRDGVRYVEVFEAVDLDAAPQQDVTVREDGVYLITGGLGGMGLVIARYLASQKRVKLGLLSRAAQPDQKGLRAIRELEALGAEVLHVSADVARPEQIESAVRKLRERFGQINGVVHAAGVAGNGFLILKEQRVFDGVLAPKIYGTWLLDRATREDELDFFINFSSAAAMIGEPGQGDYTAANSYQDAFAAFRSRQGKRTLSINWVVWKEVGLAVATGFNQKENLLFRLLTNDKAVAAFDQVLNRAVKRVLIGELNYQSEMIHVLEQPKFRLSPPIADELKRRTEPVAATAGGAPTRNASAPVKLHGKDGGAYTETELAVAEVCRDILGFDELNVYDSFFELGADSLLLKRMHAELDKRYPDRVSVADLFAHTSIVKLAEHLGAADEPAVDAEAEELAKMLEDLEQGTLSLEDALKNFR